MEEKNEDFGENRPEETAALGEPKKTGFFTKLINFIKLTINFVVLGFIAVVVSAYYIKDVNDIVTSFFPDVKLPYRHTAKVSDGVSNPDIDNLTPISNLVRKDVASPDAAASDVPAAAPIVVATAETTAAKAEQPVAAIKADAEGKADEVKTEAPAADATAADAKDKANNDDGKTDDAKQEQAKAADDDKVISDVKTVLSPEVVAEIKADAKDGADKSADVSVNAGEAKGKAEEKPEITKEVMAQVMANIEGSGKFTASSFDPVKKAEERLPADKYASASVEEKLLDLMNRDSDMVAIVKQLSERVARLEASRIDPVVVKALIVKVDNLEKRIAATPTSGSASALVIAASHLRYAVLAGGGYAYELDTMKLLAHNKPALIEELKKLDDFAVSGVKTNADLKKEFTVAVADADGHLLADRTDDLKGKIMNKLSELVVIKRIDGRPINEGLLKLSDKALPMMDADDIDGVIELIDKENSETKEYFKTFLADATDKNRILKALNAVSNGVADNFKAENNSPAAK